MEIKSEKIKEYLYILIYASIENARDKSRFSTNGGVCKYLKAKALSNNGTIFHSRDYRALETIAKMPMRITGLDYTTVIKYVMLFLKNDIWKSDLIKNNKQKIKNYTNHGK